MLLLQPLLSSADRSWHRENYLLQSGGRILPDDYLEVCQNYAFRSFCGTEIGGFSLNVNGTFRVEHALGRPLRAREQYLEISGLWIDRTRRSVAIKSLAMVSVLIAALLSQRRAIIAYTTTERLWSTLYKTLGARHT